MKKQNILIIASGAREHAIGWKLAQSPKVGKIYFAPGTPGTETVGESTGIAATDFDSLTKFAIEKKIDFTVAAPDDILAAGVVDAFKAKGLKIFGPTKKAAQIEASKAFAKKLMKEEGIPTATYKTFTDFTKAKKYLTKQSLPIVIKASGLALGKGVIIAQTLSEAEQALVDIMVKKIFGESGSEVVIEEFMQGQEVSIHAFSDGEHIALFPTSRDHKTIYEGNKGPNTGGMGTIAPLPEITDAQLEEIKKKIVIPAIKGMKKRGATFAGCLYPGLMITKDGPKVIEFNCRFGDPEIESYMRLLETDLFDILSACVDGKLDKQKITWSKKSACTIALASANYPESSHKGDVIKGLEKAEKNKDIVVFHFATKKENGNIVTNGGRVIAVTATGKNLDEALDKAYAVIGPNGIHFDGMQYRKDIGRVAVTAKNEETKQSYPKIKAVIFDMDGLIVDTEIVESKSLEKLLKQYGKKSKPHKNGLIHKIGEAGDKSYQTFKDTYNLPDSIETLRKKKRAIFAELLKENLVAYPGFINTLHAFHKKNMKIALASNRFIDHIEIIIENLKVKEYFNVVVGPNEKRKHKPAPDIFLDTAKELKVDPSECLVFEDSEIGVTAAHAAGMKVIAIPNKYTKDHDFSKADKIIDSLEDIDEDLLSVIARSETTKQSQNKLAHRIEVFSKVFDTRADVRRKKFQNKKITNVEIADVYTIDKQFSQKELEQIASALSNPVTQKINSKPQQFSYAIEIGFLPGVTDNIANTARETAADLLKTTFTDVENVYTSQVTFITGNITKSEAVKLAETLYNPLIQRMHIKSYEEFEKDGGMDVIVPKVHLEHTPQITEVNLNVADSELIKIGKEGIANPDGTRRGPLALDLTFMKTIQKYFKKLGRNPYDIELEALAQTWSEHCKHTIFADPIDEIEKGLYKTYIKGATQEIRKKKSADAKAMADKGKKVIGDFCVSVFTDNSGGIVFDDKYLVTHKVETHNSPSALDPFGGAITGIVGVNRDALGFGLGAKPVANFYGFCLADPRVDVPLYKSKDKREKMLSSKRIMEGVVEGVNAGGNQSGIPTPQGFIYFDERFRGKPLVFAGTVGLIPRKIKGRDSHIKKAMPGDLIVMIGGRVGKDGIHGATFSSETLSSGSPATAVQIGDPITQKKLSDAIVKEARDQLLYNSITDNGAGGLSSSVSEMAKESGGCVVDLEKVPLKYPGLDPWEIWISESQERMTLAVPKKNIKKFTELMQRRGVETTVIGEFTDNGKCVVKYDNKNILDMDMEFLHEGLPKRPMKSKQFNNASMKQSNKLPKQGNLTQSLTDMLKRLNITSFEFITQQYDHIVQGNLVLGPLQGRGRINAETSVIRPVLDSNKGVIMSQGLYPSYSDIDTYHMAASSLDTAVRNAIAAGANPDHLSLLDNFCWCSSDEPERLGQLKQAAKACFDYAIAYETPFISGKDSMFNDFKGFDANGKPIKISIPPTLLISSFGVVDDITKVVSLDVKNPGDLIYILGETHEELGGSEYFAMYNTIGNNIPTVDAQTNKKLYASIYKAIQKDLISSSISLTRGGLAVALAKSAIGGMLGVNIDLKKIPGDIKRDDFALYSESQGRILVTVTKENKETFEKLMKGNKFAEIGNVTKEQKIIINGLTGEKIVAIQLTQATDAYRETLKDY